MANSWWQLLITAAVAVVGGAMGSIIGPMVTWGIEKKRLVRTERKEKLAKWRKFMSDTFLDGAVSLGTWAEIKAHLTPETIEAVESFKGWSIIPSEDALRLRRRVNDELVQLERAWELV